MDRSDKLAALGIGLIGGGAISFLGWQFFAGQVNQQVDATVRHAVDDEVAHKLADAGVTPAMVASLRTILNNLESLGVLNSLATATTVPSSGVRGRR